MGTSDAERTEVRDRVDQVRFATCVPTVLVATKLTPPLAAPGLLPRTNLVDRLKTSSAKLCLISAPAGWGKTSLLAAWYEAEAGRQRLAFLRLAPGDNDVPIFWSYLIAALRTIHPEIMAGSDEMLRTPGMDPMGRIVPALINELYEIDEPTVLVLDDYHVLTEPAIHASLIYLIDHLPPTMRLVITTRSDPPLPLGRLRASNEMVEIRSEQLGLAVEEAGQFLSDRFGLDLDAESVHLLCRRTEGWPAALHLAGLSLQNEPDQLSFIEHFAGDDRNIADYLTSEVLDNLPAALREFLLHTSVLDQLTGPLCDAVTGVSGSDETLEELQRSNLFVMPLDHRRSWYRYHHLFGDWLHHRLRRTEPGAIPDLHTRASVWYGDHRFFDPAITHAVAAGDHERAGDLIDRYLTDWEQVNWSAVWRWLAELPDEIVERHPMTATARAVLAWKRGDFSAGLRWIPIAECAIAAAPDELRPTAATIVALFRAFGELVAGDMETARVGFEQIADQERPAASPAYAMAISNVGIATFWSIGALQAIPPLREGAVAREQLSLPDSGTTALLAAAYAETGDWTAAETTARTALALPQPSQHDQYPGQMPAHYALGQALVTRGESDEGIAQINQGLGQARGWVEPIFVAYGCLTLADALDGYAEKRVLVREARQLIKDSHGRGRIEDLVAAAERKLSIRQPPQGTTGTVYVEPLTNRERDVLRLLESDLSLREIGNELYLSHNTVKGYAKSIYRKLGVSSRAAAIETARGLDIP